ncbi:hypothetical protein Mia14_0288 [Candidatus Mancarchaeum acidiphilum]|uniref:Uncharacterized protein n=1 Tax=Candidatus Mancarchaeum acidiphilum TaxID=1920749 RepID=A0A218NMD0_9ARCH|nr:hypothetical protein [Candidatus Mancarchaeum acidiphilum]ASI13618.1 hypothetical protein Mia14_0288 [Candidatus Mancarchaeum acidiphilum]
MALYPKLNFTYSYIYDSTFAQLESKEYISIKDSRLAGYIDSIEKELSYFDKKVFDNFQKFSGLKWQKPYIDVYISKYAPYSLSVPLTIKIYKDAKVATAILVHELAHNIVFQNQKQVLYKKLFADFDKYSAETKYHIIEGSILYLLNKDLFHDGLGGFFRYDNWISPKAGIAYRDAISIVLREGSENIIKRYIKKIDSCLQQ